MEIKLQKECKLLTTKGLEPITECVGDAVGVPYTHTVNAEILSLGMDVLEHTTMPVYVEPTTPPEISFSLYPPTCNTPYILDKNTHLYGVIIPTYNYYKKRFAEAFMVTPHELSVVPRVGVVRINRIKVPSYYTVYNQQHSLNTSVMSAVLFYLETLIDLLYDRPANKIEDTDVDPNIIINAEASDFFVRNFGKYRTNKVPYNKNIEVVPFDKTSSTIVINKKLNDYNEEAIDYLKYVALHTRLPIYFDGNIMKVIMFGVKRHAIGRTSYVNGNALHDDFYFIIKHLRKNLEDNEFTVNRRLMEWFWKATRFVGESYLYRGFLMLVTDLARTNLSFAWKLAPIKQLFDYLGYLYCPFFIPKVEVNKDNNIEWVSVYTPEPIILQVYFPNGTILPILNL